jgi:hypothetical protein
MRIMAICTCVKAEEKLWELRRRVGQESFRDERVSKISEVCITSSKFLQQLQEGCRFIGRGAFRLLTLRVAMRSCA